MHFDLLDEGDPVFPPRFRCQHGCGVLMTPLDYTGHSGHRYRTDPETGTCRCIPLGEPQD